jgi:hypothetical protein
MLVRGPRIKDDEETAKPERESGETATSYLDRLLKHEAEEQSQQLRKMREKMLASTSSVFDQVRKSSSALGSTLSAFDQLTKSAAPVEIRAPSMDHFHAMNEQEVLRLGPSETAFGPSRPESPSSPITKSPARCELCAPPRPR